MNENPNSTLLTETNSTQNLHFKPPEFETSDR